MGGDDDGDESYAGARSWEHFRKRMLCNELTVCRISCPLTRAVPPSESLWSNRREG